MKGIDIEIKAEPIETTEEKAKRIIRKIHKIIADRKIEVVEAEDKLSEVMQKEIEDITEKDGKEYEWD